LALACHAVSDTPAPPSAETTADAAPAAPPPLAPELAAAVGGFCRAMFEGLAARRLRCDGLPPSLFAKYTDVDYECTALLDSVRRGRLAWNPAMADACLGEIGASRCFERRYLGAWDERRQVVAPACAQAMRGLVPDGEPCGFVHHVLEECADPDAACSASAGFECRGWCRRRPAQRDAKCFRTDGCAGELFCNRDGKCDLPAREGEPCLGFNEVPCAAGLVCAGASQIASGRCRPFQPGAASCTSDVECSTNNCVLRRLTPSAQPTGTCEPHRAVGQTCGDLVGNCGAGVACLGGTCRKPPVLDEICRETRGGVALLCAEGFCNTDRPRDQLRCEPYLTGMCSDGLLAPEDACGPYGYCSDPPGAAYEVCRSLKCRFEP
jgi:hypothetical protein